VTLSWDGSPGAPGTDRPPPLAVAAEARYQAMRMNHGQLVDRVGVLALEVGERYGAELLIQYNPDSRRIRKKPPFGRGFPDLVVVGRGGVLFAELKCKDDTVSPDQRRWGSFLTGAGQTWVIWEPIDALSGRIETELAALCVQYQLRYPLLPGQK
jgi:hypothetical protein